MLQRTIVSLESKQITLLKKLAEKRKTSMTALVREAVQQYTADIKDNSAQFLLTILKEHKDEFKKGFENNNDSHLSQNIDHYLYGSPKKVSSR